MEVKIKKADNSAIIPTYAKQGDAGLDLTAVSCVIKDDYIEYDTGLQFEIPDGYVGLLFPRSSISKYDLALSNAVGVVDSGYRGNVTFRFKLRCTDGNPAKIYREGDRIGQMIIIPIPKIKFVEVDSLSETERGSGGYGSSGK